MRNSLNLSTYKSIHELEKIGAELSAWVESDEYLEVAQRMEFQERNPESIAKAQQIIALATCNRPALAQAITQ